jgi:acyl-CoA reductase-like NAD-dependent aldehyde dehydrogenase
VAVDVIEARHFVGGDWSDEGERFESLASADGAVVCSAPAAPPGTVDTAVRAARAAFEGSGWKESRAAERAGVLLALADRLEAEAEPVAALVAREMGKPIRLSLDREVRGAVDKLRFFAGAARVLDGTVTGASARHLLDLTVPEPVGVCALIVPWNDPVDLAVRKLGAALAAGCTAVVKSSEETPASTEALIRLCDDLPGLPDGVVNLVHGPGRPTGEALVTHPGVDKISFTGSTTTGRRIMELAAGSLKRVSLECGGKAPALVFADCDREKALDALTYGAFLYTGQSCTAATRVIVEAPAYDAIVAGLVERAQALPVGDPLDERSLIGPLVSDRQLEVVRGFLDGLRRDGGRVLTGGHVDGRYVAPTVVAGLDPGAAAASEEIFGPVLAVFSAADEDEAVAIANGVRYGLGASVWTRDVDRALRVVRRLEAGDVWVNTHYVRQPETPFGGWKESGVGRELGLAGVGEYVAWKRVAIDTSPEFHLKVWFEQGAEQAP